MLIIGGQFGPKQGGQFALKQRGHFAPKWRGQFGRNIHQYPGIGGEAVYRARAILNLDLDDTQLNYRLGKELGIEQNLKVYPNPNNGLFQFDFKANENEKVTVTVFDALGKCVYLEELNIDKTTHSIDVSTKDNGIYFLQLNSTSGFKLSTKFSLNR
jgi:hypothetical protein